MGSKISCLAGFWYHHVTIMGAHMHAFCYPLFESGTRTGLKTITLCRKDIRSNCLNSITDSKSDRDLYN